MLIFGVLSITASLLALFLPETRGIQLPETLHDAEEIGNTTKMNNKMQAFVPMLSNQSGENTVLLFSKWSANTDEIRLDQAEDQVR